METEEEKISARIKMIDETEVTNSAQVLGGALIFVDLANDVGKYGTIV